jgi:hypothetical protein
MILSSVYFYFFKCQACSVFFPVLSTKTSEIEYIDKCPVLFVIFFIDVH